MDEKVPELELTFLNCPLFSNSKIQIQGKVCRTVSDGGHPADDDKLDSEPMKFL